MIFTICRSCGRKEATRTPDPYVPNVVRYQLRYFPMIGRGVSLCLMHLYECAEC